MAAEIGELLVRQTQKHINTVDRLKTIPRLAGMAYDILDNIGVFPQVSVESEDKMENIRLLNRIVPSSLRKTLLLLTGNWQQDQSSGVIEIAGKKLSHTGHPHFFEITRTQTGLRLTFVDPEYSIGERSKLRPNVSNLIAVEIFDDPDLSANFIYIKYNTAGLSSEQLKLSPQYSLCRQLLPFKGLHPDINPKRVLFRLFVSEANSILQTRYSTKKGAQRFLGGEKGGLFLEGQLDNIRSVIFKFKSILDNPNPGEAAKYQGLKKRL